MPGLRYLLTGRIIKFWMYFLTFALRLVFIILCPILFILHYYLRQSGRNGFYFGKQIYIGAQSFQQRERFLDRKHDASPP